MNGGTTKLKRKLLAAVAVSAGMLATIGIAAPAQAAPPEEISHDQVNQTTNRGTPVPPANLHGTIIELRSGYYGGYQYGWVRLAPGSRYRYDDALVLQIKKSATADWEWGPLTSIQPGGPTFTRGRLTHADPNYRFRGCIFRGADYACTDRW